jgi:glycerophosphoryl diester phosphodiesterase
MGLLQGLDFKKSVKSKENFLVLEKKNKILNIAHKGASEYYPENTIIAFEKAIEMGADMLEVDLRLSKDAQVVIFHDEKVRIRKNGKRAISELTLSEIKEVELDKNQRIPTFKEVVSEFKERCRFYIDLKGETALEYAIAILQEENCINRAILGISNPTIVEKARALNGNISISLLLKLHEMDKTFELGRKFKPDYLHPCWENYSKTPSSLLTEDFFKKAKEGNFCIVTWHEENEQELKNLSSLPVYGICTDKPGLLSKILKKTDETLIYEITGTGT